MRAGYNRTKVVYCKDANRAGQYPEQSFDLSDYTFRPRLASNQHAEPFVASIPVVSKRLVRGCGSAYPVGEYIVAATLNGADRCLGLPGTDGLGALIRLTLPLETSGGAPLDRCLHRSLGHS